MRKSIYALFLILLFSGVSQAQVISGGGGGGSTESFTSYTVATLPTAYLGRVVYVTDGANAADCQTTGGGAFKNTCVYNGAAWVPVGIAGTGTGDLKADGTVPLSANWDVGSFQIRAETFRSDVATGTAPFTVASATEVTNLRAATATALAANPTDCASNQFANAIDASGNITCAALALAGAQFANQGTTTTILHGNAAGNPSFASVSGADFANKTANYVLAGPTSGDAAAPDFRALVSADIPNNAANTSGTSAGLSATLAVTSGGTNKTAWTQYLIPYADTTTSFSQIAIGTAGQFLRSGGAGSAPAFATLPANSSTAAGTVATGAAQVNKVWKTDADGAPDWRDDATGGTPTFDTVATGTNVSATMTVASGAVIIPSTGIVEANRIYAAADTPATKYITFTGVSAPRIITVPDAAFTAARTDAGQTFTGVNVFTAPTITTSIAPTVAGASTLGTTSAEWGNLYLTDSAVIYGQADQSNSLTSAATGWTANLKFSAPTLVASAANSLTVGTSSSATGSVLFKNSSNANTFTISSGATGGAIGWTLPTANAGGAGYLVNSGATGILSYTDPDTFSVKAGSSSIVTVGTLTAGALGTGFTAVNVAQGGTGRATGTTAYSLIATGTTATGAQQTLGNGGTTQILVGGGASALPAWGTDLPTAVTIGNGYIYRAGGTDVPVSDGGTGASTFALNGVLYGNGTSPIGVTAIGGAGQLLRVGSSPYVPAWTTLTMPATIAAGSVFAANSANTLSAITSASGTYFLKNVDGTISWAAGVGTIGGSTGSTDNVILTADGTGGVTIQANPGGVSISDTGVVSAASFSATAADGSNKLTISNNTAISPTASAMEIYPEANVWKINQNGTEYSIPLSVAANQISFATAGTSGGIPYFSASNTISSSAALTQYGILAGGGAGASPVALTPGTDNQVLLGHTGAAASFGSLGVAALPTVTASKGGTGVANNDANTITFSGGNYSFGLTLSGNTGVTFPTSGTLATTAGTLPIGGGTLTGNLLFTDNTLDIGATGATRPRTGYFGTSLNVQATTNQLVLGATPNFTTVNFPASSGAVTVTMPNTTSTVAILGANAFIGAQTYTGSGGLTSPPITTDIRAATAGGATLGTAALPFSSAYIGGAFAYQITGSAPSAARIVNLSDIGATGYIPLLSATSTTAGQVPLATAVAGKETYSTGALSLAVNLTVQTAAVTLTGKSGGSSLTLPTALSLDGTMTNTYLCKYTSSGTLISCDVDPATLGGASPTITGSGLTAGKVYYMSGSGLALADNTASTAVPGLCVATSTTLCQDAGSYTTGSWTQGALIYVGTSGTLTATKPTAAGTFVSIVGVAESATAIRIHPQLITIGN